MGREVGTIRSKIATGLKLHQLNCKVIMNIVLLCMHGATLALYLQLGAT